MERGLRGRHRRPTCRSRREAEAFLPALAGVTDPETKRKIIGREFIRAFERAARAAEARPASASSSSRARCTRTWSSPAGGPARRTSSSHHNVGGLPDDLKFRLVEPLRWLFKDEVRRVGEELGLPAGIVWRQPFPGPGLAHPDHRRGHRASG